MLEVYLTIFLEAKLEFFLVWDTYFISESDSITQRRTDPHSAHQADTEFSLEDRYARARSQLEAIRLPAHDVSFIWSSLVLHHPLDKQ